MSPGARLHPQKKRFQPSKLPDKLRAATVHEMSGCSPSGCTFETTVKAELKNNPRLRLHDKLPAFSDCADMLKMAREMKLR